MTDNDVPIDMYINYIDDDNLFNLEYLQGCSVLNIKKLRDSLINLCKKKNLSDSQNNQLNQLNIELEKYDDDVGLSKTQFNAKKQQRHLFFKACINQNKANLLCINKNYEELSSFSRETTRKQVNAYMVEKLTCECGVEICRAHMSRHKQTKLHFQNLNNEPKLIITADDKRKQVNAYMVEKITCECGAEICRAHMSRHKQTKIHLAKMVKIE